MRFYFNSVAFGLCAIFSSAALSEQPNSITNNTKNYGIELGVTRIIYDLGKSSAALRVTNKQAFPILVQSQVYMEDKKTEAPFLVTPPIQRLESGSQTRLRVILADNTINNNEEKLFWMCVKGIPPSNVYDEDTNLTGANHTFLNVNVLNTSCIKLITRPTSLRMTPYEASKDLKWEYNNGKLIVKNESPLYVNFNEVKFNNKKINLNGEYLSPYGNLTFSVSDNGPRKLIEWSALDDYGAVTPISNTQV